MPIKVGTYDTDSAKKLSLEKLLAIFTTRAYLSARLILDVVILYVFK